MDARWAVGTRRGIAPWGAPKAGQYNFHQLLELHQEDYF